MWENGKGEGLYVKDWHLLGEVERAGRGVEEVYVVPECFRGGSKWNGSRRTDVRIYMTANQGADEKMIGSIRLILQRRGNQ